MIDSVPEWDEVVLDDGALLLDRLVRSLPRNKDGFLSTDEKNPRKSIDGRQNAVCLYIYTVDDELFTLNTFYVYGGHQQHTYEEWREIAFTAIDELNEQAEDNWHGVYAWSVTTIRVTPIRTGDLFIAVDTNGARGVRISFDTKRNERAARKS
jgi:hypothetical protein